MGVGLLLLCCLVAIGATASAQSLGNERSGRIWTIAIGHDWGAHEYLDDAGYLQGFGFKFLELICAEAGMDCRIIRDKYRNCWVSMPGERSRGGQGLMSGWYDACTAWVQTIERIHTFDFSLPYLKNQKSYFFSEKGKDFDPRDLSRKRIAFIDGWASSEQCVARATNIKNNVLPKERIFHVKSPTEALEYLDGNKVEAVFTTMQSFNETQLDRLERANFPVNCFLNGNSMMSRVDSGFPSAFNVGLNKARSNGKFLKLCQSAETDYGTIGKIDCVDSY